jgi:MFS family permease
MSGARRYKELLGIPHAKAMLGWSMLGRLPLGMTPLALLFLVRAEGYGYGAAGVAVALYAVAVGIGAPVRGRQVDRDGPTPVLRVRAIAYPVLLSAVILLAVVDAGIVPITAAAALAGFSLPPLSAAVRIVWPRLAPDDLRSTAYALEAALQEVFFVGGPLIAAGLAAVEPIAAVAGAGVACLVGTTATARLAPVRETPPSRAAGAGVLGALGSPGVRTVVLYAVLAGVAFGAVELAMPAFAEERGARELGGIAIACFAAGSLVGGLVAGMRAIRNELHRFVGGALALVGALLGLQLAMSLPTLYLRVRRGPPHRAHCRGAVHAHRSLGEARDCGGGVRVVRDRDLGRHCRGLRHGRCPCRRARRAVGFRVRRSRCTRGSTARLGAPGDPRRFTVYAASERP